MVSRGAMQAGTGATAGVLRNALADAKDDAERSKRLRYGALTGALGGFTGGSIASGLISNKERRYLGDLIGGAAGGALASGFVSEKREKKAEVPLITEDTARATAMKLLEREIRRRAKNQLKQMADQTLQQPVGG
jgi:hypothetical protein